MPALLLFGNRLVGLKAFFETKTRGRIAETQNARTVRELEQEHFNVAFHTANLVFKPEAFQHFV